MLLLLLRQALEIKRLNAAIAGLRSELNKQEEALEDCRRCVHCIYKDVLCITCQGHVVSSVCLKLFVHKVNKQEEVLEDCREWGCGQIGQHSTG